MPGAVDGTDIARVFREESGRVERIELGGSATSTSAEAADAYRRALGQVSTGPERRYLERRLGEVAAT